VGSISEVDIEQPCTDNDIDYYKNESGDKIIPRLVGWLTVLGIDPPPLLSIGSLSSEEESNRPTPEDIAMLPEWKSYKLPGISEGMKLFQKDGKAVTSEWNAKSKRWSRPEEIVEANYENSYFIKWMRTSIQYEHAFPMTMGRGESEQHLTVGFNYGDDPLAVARRVVDEYNLDLTDADWYLLGIIEFVRERVTKIPPPTRMDQKEVHELHRSWFIFILVLFALPGLIHLYTRLQSNKSMPRHKKRKKAMKPPGLSTAPPKIPSKKEKKKKESSTCQSSTNYDARTTKAVLVIFVILSCKAWLAWEYLCKDPHKTCDVWADVGSCDKNSIEGSIQYRTVCRPLQTLPVRNLIFVVCSLLLSILFLSVMILLLFRGVCPKLILIVNFISRVLRMPYDLYQVTKIKQTIYVKSSQSKNLRGKKRKGIVNKSGVDDIHIVASAVGDNYIPIHMSGSRRSVREAIELIQEAVGTENVSIKKPSSTVSRPPNQEEDVPIESKTSASEDISNGSKPQQNLEESNTPETPVQCETINNNVNNLTKEVAVVETSPVNAVPKEEVPSEIGIDSCQGMITRETITDASISSLNDRSNTSKAYSNFTLNENDPLLIFLRSQASCIKGSVDEFYTWLVKSEDIDSMMALKEAVNEDDYLNDMKVGDGEGSGVKGFKRKAFLRAISEYFNDESDDKSTAEEHQSLPQCQEKNIPDTLEPPEELVCPISLHLMTNDPVVAADGITYERASIEDWFKKSKAKISEAEKNLKHNPHSEADQRIVENGVCSPVYGNKLDNLALVPHTGTRNMARSFKEEAGS